MIPRHRVAAACAAANRGCDSAPRRCLRPHRGYGWWARLRAPMPALPASRRRPERIARGSDLSPGGQTFVLRSGLNFEGLTPRPDDPNRKTKVRPQDWFICRPVTFGSSKPDISQGRQCAFRGLGTGLGARRRAAIIAPGSARGLDVEERMRPRRRPLQKARKTKVRPQDWFQGLVHLPAGDLRELEIGHFAVSAVRLSRAGNGAWRAKARRNHSPGPCPGIGRRRKVCGRGGGRYKRSIESAEAPNSVSSSFNSSRSVRRR